MIEARLQKRLQDRAQQHLLRERIMISSPQSIQVISQGKLQISFASNDYLGLANNQLVIKAFQDGAELYGVGSGASQLITGYSKAHRELEEALADFTRRDRVLLFSNGFMANLGAITTLLHHESDVLFQDRDNHASLIDAGLACKAKLQRYAHNDMVQLENLLSASPALYKLIATDAIFSMDGSIAPLRELATLSKQQHSTLYVDDAHGFGIFGHGRGTVLEHDLTQQDVPVLMAPFGKAFGTYGAFVAGSEVLIDSLLQFARSAIYTTALPSACAVATLKSLEIIQAETWRREKLFALIAHFKKTARQLELPILDSNTPIQALIVQDNQTVMQFKKQLNDQGFLVGAIRAPTVPTNSPRLRISLSADHSEEHVNMLLESIKELSFHPNHALS